MVVCQKVQDWTLDHLKSMVIGLMKNPVPIGFTYVQLPHEKKPVEIWPWMIWEDVSANYSGVFFRVIGGEAASFGNIQQENIPRINKFVSAWWDYQDSTAHKNQVAGDQIIDIPMLLLF